MVRYLTLAKSLPFSENRHLCSFLGRCMRVIWDYLESEHIRFGHAKISHFLIQVRAPSGEHWTIGLDSSNPTFLKAVGTLYEQSTI